MSDEGDGGSRRPGTTEDYNLAEEDTEYEAYFIEEIFVDEDELTGMYEEQRAAFYQQGRAAGKWVDTRPARGLTQQLKSGVQKGKRMMETLKQGAKVKDKFMVLEIFSGSSMLTQTAMEMTGWGAYQPIDVLLGEDGDMTKKANRERVKDTVSTGPWCAWTMQGSGQLGRDPEAPSAILEIGARNMGHPATRRPLVSDGTGAWFGGLGDQAST